MKIFLSALSAQFAPWPRSLFALFAALLVEAVFWGRPPCFVLLAGFTATQVAYLIWDWVYSARP